MTRADGIALLGRLGVYARERDWALGETILVAPGPSYDRGDGLKIFDALLYIYPAESGGWRIMWTENPDDETCYTSLENACYAARDILKPEPK